MIVNLILCGKLALDLARCDFLVWVVTCRIILLANDVLAWVG